MANVEDIKTDPQIADILKRLKNTSKSVSKKDSDVDLSDKQEVKNEKPSYAIPAKEIPVAKSSESVPRKEEQISDNSTEVSVSLDSSDSLPETKISNDKKEEVTFTEDYEILPWFSKSDKDLNYIHYIKLDDSGNIEYVKVKNDISAEELAALKLKNDFICDVDYYKSKHYVLCVKNVDSNYAASRSYVPKDESLIRESVDDQDMVKVDSDRLQAVASDTDRYYHYVVYTDLGIANFIVRQDDVPYPYGETDLNKWFEKISNRVQIKNPLFEKNYLRVSEDSEKIKEFKYDIITMHRPGVITLDSIDNQDQDYQLHIKLKDEFSFLPMNRVLGCLKLYSSDSKKSFNDFRKFIDTYFDVSV